MSWDAVDAVDFDALSEQRLRSENQDAHLEMVVGGGLLLVVCDGMGGVQGGSLASRLAVESIRDVLRREHDAHTPWDALGEAVRAGNQRILDETLDQPHLMGMGTTVVAVWIRADGMYGAWVGDSRLGLVRDGKLQWLSRDHTRVMELVRLGRLTLEEAEDHPEGHVLSRAVGVDPELQVELLEPVALQQGDRLLLCSDGVHGPLSKGELAEVIQRQPVEDAAVQIRQLLEERRGDDNATAILAHVNTATGTPPPLPEAAPEPDPWDDDDDDAQRQGRRAGVPLVLASGVLVVGLALGAVWFSQQSSDIGGVDDADTTVVTARANMAVGRCDQALGDWRAEASLQPALSTELVACYRAHDVDPQKLLMWSEDAPANVQRALEQGVDDRGAWVLEWGDARLTAGRPGDLEAWNRVLGPGCGACRWQAWADAHDAPARSAQLARFMEIQSMR